MIGSDSLSNLASHSPLTILCPLMVRLKHLVVQELLPQQQQLQQQQQTAATATGTATPAATPATAAVAPAVAVVAPPPPSNPKWVDRPRTSLHARAYLRLGMWQWAMNEVGRGGHEWGREGIDLRLTLISKSIPIPTDNRIIVFRLWLRVPVPTIVRAITSPLTLPISHTFPLCST